MSTFIPSHRAKEAEKMMKKLEAAILDEDYITAADEKAEEIVSYSASKVRMLLAQKKYSILTMIWKDRLASDAIKAVEVLESANALIIPSIGMRLAQIALNRLYLEKSINNNNHRYSYWKAYYDSSVTKWKFIETAEKYGLSPKEILIIVFRNPYVNTYSEEDAEKSVIYWKEETDKLMINF